MPYLVLFAPALASLIIVLTVTLRDQWGER